MNINQQNGFNTPENYFSDFRAQLNQKIQLQKAVPTQQNTISRFTFGQFSVAASILVLFVSSILLMDSPNNQMIIKKANIVLSDVDYYDIEINDLYYAFEEGVRNTANENETGEAIEDFLSQDPDFEEILTEE